MKSGDFKFVMDSGRIVYVCAESRKEAVKIFCEEQGVPEDFVKRHCLVKYMGYFPKGGDNDG